MEKEIKELIERNLPKQTGEVLAKRLEEAAELEEKFLKLSEKNDSLKKQNDELTKLKLKKTSLDIIELQQKSQQEALDKAAINLKVDELEYKLNAEKEKTQLVTNFTTELFKNRSVGQRLISSGGIDGYNDSNGNWVNQRYTHGTTDVENYEKEG